jgi:hypothetical protein
MAKPKGHELLMSFFAKSSRSGHLTPTRNYQQATSVNGIGFAPIWPTDDMIAA